MFEAIFRSDFGLSACPELVERVGVGSIFFVGLGVGVLVGVKLGAGVGVLVEVGTFVGVGVLVGVGLAVGGGAAFAASFVTSVLLTNSPVPFGILDHDLSSTVASNDIESMV